ncbi:MAG: phage portal protein [Candidatus Margulisiibacteriota bacterium]
MMRELGRKNSSFRVIREWGGEGGGPARSKFINTADYLSAAQALHWVGISCSLIGEDVGMAKGGVYDRKSKLVEDEDLVQLLENPNPTMTSFQFNEMMSWFLLLAGNAYILKTATNMFEKIKNRPGALWLLNPALTEPVVDVRSRQLTGYEMRWGTETVRFAPDEIVHLKLPNPMDDFRGMGKIQYNATLFNTDLAAQIYNWNFFEKGGQPATALVLPEHQEPEQIKELEEQFEKYRGVKNSHRNITLHGGMDIKNIGLSQKDMAFFELMKYTREGILGIFKIPPAIAGIFEAATIANSNSQSQDAFYWARAVYPLLVRIQEAKTIGIVRLFNQSWGYYYEDVRRKDNELNMKLYSQGVLNAGLSPNEGRVLYLDLPKVEKNPAMDGYYLPINMIPIADAAGTTEPAPPAGGKRFGTKKITASVRQQIYKASLNTRKKIGKTIKTEMKTFFDRQEERVLAKLETQKSLTLERKISAEDIFDFEREKTELLQRIRKGHLGVMLRAIEDVNGALGTEVEASVENPQVTAGIARLAQKVTLVNQTTKDAIDAEIRAGVDAGESIADLKARIEGIYDQARGYRAEMIARTESAAAYDRGSILSYKAADIQFVDVIGCTTFEPDSDCGATHIPIDEADGLEFHPNHTGCIVPEVG